MDNQKGNVITVEATQPGDRDRRLNLRDYIEVVWRRRGLALMAFLAIFASATAFTFTRNPEYQSAALIRLNDNLSGGSEIQKQASTDSNFQYRYVDTEIAAMRSKILAEKLQNKMNLTESLDFMLPENRLIRWIRSRIAWLIRTGRSDPAEERLEKENEVIKKIEQSLTVSHVPLTNLIYVSMQSHIPQLAQSMLQNYLEIHFATKLSYKRNENVEAMEWLRAEIAKVQNQLAQSELELMKFVAKHGIVVSSDGGMAEVADFVKRKKESLVKSQEIQAKLKALDTTVEMPAGIAWTTGPEDELIKRLKTELGAMESEYSSFRELYAEGSPKSRMLFRKIQALQAKIAAFQKVAARTAVSTALKEEEFLQRSVGEAQQEALRVGNLGAQYTILKRNVDSNSELHHMLVKEFKETHLKANTRQTHFTVIDPPTLPTEAAWPKKKLFLAGGGTVGILGALLTVFLADFKARSSDVTDAVEQKFNLVRLGNVPDASKLPSIARGNSKDGYEFLAYDQPNSPIADSMRNIHSLLLFSQDCGEGGKIVVSSALPGEGKTFIATSLSTMLTGCDSKRVLLLDCDFRSPRLGLFFSTNEYAKGLTTLLSSRVKDVDRFVHKTRVPGLFYMAAGPRMRDHVAALMSPRFAQIVNRLSEQFDFLIFDAPPLLAFPESRILCQNADGVLLVVRQGYANRSECYAAAEVISKMERGRIFGVILNKTSPPATPYRYDRYYRYS